MKCTVLLLKGRENNKIRMESLLKDFELEAKNPSKEALRRWRSAVRLVKNPRRRFRMVADLEKRDEAEKMKQKIQVSFLFFFFIYLFMACLDS